MQPSGGRKPRHIPLLALLLTTLFVACDSSPSSTSQPSPDDYKSGPPATGPALDRSVRVALLREATGCLLAISQPFDVLDPRSGRVLAAMDHPTPLTVSFAGGVVKFASSERTFDADVLELRPRAAGLVGLQTPEGLHRYRGRLRFVRQSPTTALVLNIVDMEDYLLGVVPAELPADFEPAAQRAQAIAARTFAWYHKRFYGPRQDWDLLATEGSQVYRGANVESRSPEGVKAVHDTRGIVCAYSSPEGERIFPAYFSSTCGGGSRISPRRKGEPEYPPLAGNVRCDFCSPSPAYRWPAVSIPKKQITERLRERYSRIAAIGPIVGLEITERTPLGRPVQVAVSDAAGRQVSLDVEDFRLTVDPTGRVIKSGHFTPVVQKDSILFTDGRGFGHGWGLCQYGANTLAQSGKTASEILSFYYPGCQLVRAY